MRKYDSLGDYWYAPGHCIRDAFRQYYGGTIDGWFPEDCSWERVGRFAAAHGLDYCIDGRFDRSFSVGAPVVWLYEQPGVAYGHATFSRDPQQFADAKRAGAINLIGYVALEA